MNDKFKVNKLTIAHVKLTAFSRMNVRLATQVLSLSTATDLKNRKEDERFENKITDELIEFIIITDFLTV